MLILDFSLGVVAGRKDANERGSIGEVLFIKLRPAPPLISVFPSHNPAVLFVKYRSAPPQDEVLCLRPRLLACFSSARLLILDFSPGGVAGQKHEWQAHHPA
jgi:hypothetical protein